MHAASVTTVGFTSALVETPTKLSNRLLPQDGTMGNWQIRGLSPNQIWQQIWAYRLYK